MGGSPCRKLQEDLKFVQKRQSFVSMHFSRSFFFLIVGFLGALHLNYNLGSYAKAPLPLPVCILKIGFELCSHNALSALCGLMNFCDFNLLD